MKKIVMTAALSAGLLAGCGGGGLSDQDRTDFLAGCEQGGSSAAACECILDYFVENGVESPEDITAELTIEAGTACAGEQ